MHQPPQFLGSVDDVDPPTLILAQRSSDAGSADGAGTGGAGRDGAVNGEARRWRPQWPSWQWNSRRCRGQLWPANFLDPIEAILKGGAKFFHSFFKFRCARVLLGVGKRYAKRLASFTDCGILQTKDCCTIGKRRIVPLWWQWN